MAQGAVGVESRATDTSVHEIISKLDHRETHYAVNAERALVDAMDGGCQVPIGAYATVNKELITVRGLVASLNGESIYKSEKIGPIHESIDIGHDLGNELLKMGADEVLKNVLQ